MTTLRAFFALALFLSGSAVAETKSSESVSATAFDDVRDCIAATDSTTVNLPILRELGWSPTKTSDGQSVDWGEAFGLKIYFFTHEERDGMIFLDRRTIEASLTCAVIGSRAINIPFETILSEYENEFGPMLSSRSFERQDRTMIRYYFRSDGHTINLEDRSNENGTLFVVAVRKVGDI